MSKKDKKKDIKCNCSPECDCGCQEGKECKCEDKCTCSDNCECGCQEGKECTCNDDNCNCECGDECHCDNEKCCCDEAKELELTGKINALQEALLREKAEVQNYKRRKDEEVSRILKYANEDIILEFLPILDNLERAIKMDDNDLTDEVSKYLEGIKMVYSQTKTMLEHFDVHEIDTLGKKFDPMYHQAVLTGKDDSKESGTVLEVYQKGYMYKDKVIRVSMVKVNE